jgi:ribosomal protein S18 acetylase RimI-like enzyme
MTTDHDLSLVDRALYEAWVEHPGNEVSRTDRWAQLVTPGVRRIFRNGVFRSVLEEHEANATIAKTIERYRTLGQRFWWVVTPSARPADLGDRLLAAGFRRINTAVGMIAEPGQLSIPRAEGVEAEVVGERSFDEWWAVQTQGWSMPAEPEAARAEANDRLVHLLLRVGGAPAGSGSIQLLEGFAHLFGGVTLPAFRNRGVFRTRVSAALEILAERGIPHVTAHCIHDTSAPIFRRFGFREVCEIAYYEHDAGAAA